MGAQAELVRTLQGRLLQRSILLAVESARLVPSLEADQALRNGLALQPKPVLQIPHIKNIEALAVSPDAKSLVIVDAQDETASIIDINTRAPLASVDHDKQITSAAYSPTGKLLATGSRDQTVRLWSTTDYKEIARLPHDDRVYAVAFSPDGKFLASGSGTMGTHRPGKPPETRKGRLRVWALNSEEQVDLRTIADIPLESPVLSLALHPTKHWLAFDGDNDTARVFDFDTGKEVWDAEGGGPVEDVAFSRDGRYLAVGIFESYASLYDVETQHLVATFGGRNDGVRRVAFADNTHLVTGSPDGTVRVWSLDTGDEMRRISADPSFAVMPDGRIAVGGEGEITVWDWASKSINVTMSQANNFFSPDGRQVIGLDENNVWIADAGTGKLVRHMEYDTPDKPLAVSPDGTIVVVADATGRATVEQAYEGRRVQAVLERAPDLKLSPDQPAGEFSVSAEAKFSPDGNHLATSAFDQPLRIWDAKSWTLERAIQVPGIEEIEFSGNSKRVLAIVTNPDQTKRIVIWGVGSESPLADVQLPAMFDDGPTPQVALSWDGTRFALIPRLMEAAELLLWETAGGHQIARIEDQAFTSIAFSPDGTLLAAATDKDTVQLLDAGTGRGGGVLRHDGWVRDTTFDTSGRFLATASDDRTSRIWEVATRREVARMKQPNSVLRVTFSPDGKLILNELEGGNISIWPWRDEELVAEACHRLTRNLTAEEWHIYLPGEPRKTCPNLP